MRISDWSSDVCSSDLLRGPVIGRLCVEEERRRAGEGVVQEGLQEGGVDLAAVVVAGEGPDLVGQDAVGPGAVLPQGHRGKSEEHTSELQSLMRISYAVFCLKKKNRKPIQPTHQTSI